MSNTIKKFLFSIQAYSLHLGLLILRLTAGGLMFFNHGLGKIERLQTDPDKFMSFMGLSPHISLCLIVFAEAICSALVALGLLTRTALLVLIIAMLVAFFKSSAESFKDGESALFYLLCYVTLFLTGPGNFSLDNAINNKIS